MTPALQLIATCAYYSRLGGLIASITLLLSACALPDKPRAATSYDFGPGSATGATPTPVSTSTLSTLPAIVLLEVESTPALDGNALLYRLAYADAQALLPYAQARWSMPPAQLLKKEARARLGADRPILSPGETVAGSAAPWQLRLELEEFSQVFDAPAASSGLVRLRVSVTQPSPQGERLIGQRWVTAQRPAATPDAPAGVRALSAASQAALDEIGVWLRQLRER